MLSYAGESHPKVGRCRSAVNRFCYALGVVIGLISDKSGLDDVRLNIGGVEGEK